MKKLATAMLSLGLLAGTCTGAMAAEPEIYYNGNALTLNQPAIIQDGRTLLGVRDMAEQMGVDVSWDTATRIATVSYNDTTIKLQPDLHRVIVDGTVQTVDVGPQIVNDRIYLPLRYLFEMLDGEVTYTQATDGTAKVSVFSKDSYANYYKVNGRDTTVLHNNSAFNGENVIMLHDGNMVDINIIGNQLNVYRTDRLHNQISETSEHTWLRKTITGFEEVNGSYYAVLDEQPSTNYVGSGYHPVGNPFIKEILTPQGEFTFYGSEAGLNTYALESDKGFSSVKVDGYLLHVTEDIKDTSYAFSNQKGYGFLTDGQLLLIANTPGEGYKVLSCNTISNTMRDGKLFTQNGDYYAIGSDLTDSGTPEVFVTSYSANGRKNNSYVPVSNFGDMQRNRYLNILDAVQIGSKAYLLLQTDTARYLGCYDLTAHTFTSETLTQPFERFVPANGSWQLYYCDKDYYHFRTVQ